MFNHDWKEEPNISKISLPGSTTQYSIKDAEAREVIDTLGTAAYKNYCESIIGSTLIPTDGAVKTYVDTEIGKINKFDVIVPEADAQKIPAGAIYKDGETVITGELAASASTMYKLYLVKNSDAGAGAHIEWITLDQGSSYSEETRYKWEQIGTTVVDLTNYVQKSTQIAGVTINSGISKDDMQSALDINGITIAQTATGHFTLDGTKVTGQTATGTPLVSLTGSLATIDTAITSSCSYQPVGSNAASEVTINSSNATVVSSVSYDSTNERISFTTAQVIGSINSATAAAQTFTGTTADISVSGTYLKTTIGTLATKASATTFSVSDFNIASQAVTVVVTPD